MLISIDLKTIKFPNLMKIIKLFPRKWKTDFPLIQKKIPDSRIKLHLNNVDSINKKKKILSMKSITQLHHIISMHIKFN